MWRAIKEDSWHQPLVSVSMCTRRYMQKEGGRKERRKKKKIRKGKEGKEERNENRSSSWTKSFCNRSSGAGGRFWVCWHGYSVRQSEVMLATFLFFHSKDEELGWLPRPLNVVTMSSFFSNSSFVNIAIISNLESTLAFEELQVYALWWRFMNHHFIIWEKGTRQKLSKVQTVHCMVVSNLGSLIPGRGLSAHFWLWH